MNDWTFQEGPAHLPPQRGSYSTDYGEESRSQRLLLQRRALSRVPSGPCSPRRSSPSASTALMAVTACTGGTRNLCHAPPASGDGGSEAAALRLGRRGTSGTGRGKGRGGPATGPHSPAVHGPHSHGHLHRSHGSSPPGRWGSGPHLLQPPARSRLAPPRLARPGPRRRPAPRPPARPPGPSAGRPPA